MKRILILLFLIPILLTGCDDQSENCQYLPKVEDLTGGLPNRVSEVFLNYKFCPGVVPILSYTDTLQPLLHVGSQADEIFERLAKTEPDFESRGLLVVVSKSPKLIQLRLGNRYKMYANLVGITSGKDYLALQQHLKTAPIHEVLPAFLQNVCIRVEELNSLPSYKKSRINSAINTVANFLDYIATPSENLYGRWILLPITTVLLFCINLCHHMFWGLCLMIALFLGMRWSFFWIIRTLWFNSTSTKYRTFVSLADWLMKLIISISVTAAALLLSSRRTEDLIALHALGIPYLNTLVENFNSLNISTLWSSILFIAIYGLKILFCKQSFLYAIIPTSRQKIIYHSLSPETQGILIGTSQADANKIETSETPFLDMYIQETAERTIVQWMMISLAALFLFPSIVLYVGIALESIQIFIFLPQLIRFIRSDRFSLKDRTNFNTKLKIAGVFFLITTAIVIFLCYLLNPTPTQQKIDPSTAYSEQVNFNELAGEYAFEEISGEIKNYGSAELKTQNFQTYQLIVAHPTGLQGFQLQLDTLNTIFTNEHLGTGIIHYNRELNIIKITFQIDQLTWTLTR